MPFNNIETMISMVNSTVYGLQAGVFTKDLDLAKHLFEELDVGTLIVNDAPTFRAEHFPFGGMKQSGIGREGVGYAIKEMSVIKSLVL
jgi:acyl-CoA reductase-like NAD-dependent aldehyde dehydrogenase